MTIVDKIDCVGTVMPSAPTNRICAVSGTSYFMKDSWTILLESSALQVTIKYIFKFHIKIVSWKSCIFRCS